MPRKRGYTHPKTASVQREQAALSSSSTRGSSVSSVAIPLAPSLSVHDTLSHSTAAITAARAAPAVAPRWRALEEARRGGASSFEVGMKRLEAELATVLQLKESGSPEWKAQADSLLLTLPVQQRGGPTLSVGDVQGLVSTRFSDDLDLGVGAYLVYRQTEVTGHVDTASAKSLIETMKRTARDPAPKGSPPKYLPEHLLCAVPPERLFSLTTHELRTAAHGSSSSPGSSLAARSIPATSSSTTASSGSVHPISGPLIDHWARNPEDLLELFRDPRTRALARSVRGEPNIAGLDFELRVDVSADEAEDLRAMSSASTDSVTLAVRVSQDPLRYRIFCCKLATREWSGTNSDGLAGLSKELQVLAVKGPVTVWNSSRIDERAALDIASKTGVLGGDNLSSRSFGDGAFLHLIPMRGSGAVKAVRLTVLGPAGFFRRAFHRIHERRWNLGFTHTALFYGLGGEEASNLLQPSPMRPPPFAKEAAAVAPDLRLQAAKVVVDAIWVRDLTRTIDFFVRRFIASGWLESTTFELTTAGQMMVQRRANDAAQSIRGGGIQPMRQPVGPAREDSTTANLTRMPEEDATMERGIGEDAFDLFVAVLAHEYSTKEAPYAISGDRWHKIIEQNPITMAHVLTLLHKRERDRARDGARKDAASDDSAPHGKKRNLPLGTETLVSPKQQKTGAYATEAGKAAVSVSRDASEIEDDTSVLVLSSDSE